MAIACLSLIYSGPQDEKNICDFYKKRSEFINTDQFLVVPVFGLYTAKLPHTDPTKVARTTELRPTVPTTRGTVTVGTAGRGG